MRLREHLGQFASLVLVTAIVVTLGAIFLSSRLLWHLVRVETSASAARLTPHSHVSVRRATSVTSDSTESAIRRDPFNVSRLPPRQGFHFTGESTPSDSLTSLSRSAASAVRLIGTVVGEKNGGFIICQLGEDAPRVLRVNERLGNLTLKQVARERAVFIDSTGELIVIQTSKKGA
jgi:hypothetical protein